MFSKLKLCSTLFYFALLAILAESRVHIYDRVDGQHKWKSINFISNSQPSRTELDLRVSYKGILAMETLIPSMGEKGLFLRRVTNGRSLVSMIYSTKDVLVDCEILNEQEYVDEYISKFFMLSQGKDWRKTDLKDMVAGRVARSVNSTFEDLGKKPTTAPSEYIHMLNFEVLKLECKELQAEIQDLAKHSEAQNGLRMKQSENKDNEVGLEDDEDEFQKVLKKSNSKVHRAKRAMFIFPGTKWCGSGTTASSYYDVGENIETDKCCRAHDHCTVTIEGFSNKYNYFNYRFHTLSHCECDDQFHTCLKTSGDDASDMVGSLFFNVIGNKCFILKEEKECAKRSWWGKCIRYKKKRQAELRDPLSF